MPAHKFRILPDHPDLFDLPEKLAPLALPPVAAEFNAPIRWDEDATVKTSKGTRKKRFGSFEEARRMLGCEKEKMRAILASGLIYAYRGTDAKNSWWTIDLAGLYLYRENQRRRGLGMPPTADWAAYSDHMRRLNAASPDLTEGPPPIPPAIADAL